jgi:hypothetical protein
MKNVKEGLVNVIIISLKGKVTDYLLILVLSTFSLSWFEQNLLKIGGDFVLPLNPISYVSRLFYTWNPWVDLGLPSDNLSKLPFYCFFAVLQILGCELLIAQKAYYFFVFFLSGTSMYYLMSTIVTSEKDGKESKESRRVICLFSALFYMFNPYTMIFLHKPIIFLVYALIPFILGLFIKGLTSQTSFRHKFYAAIVYSLISITFPNYNFLIISIGIAILYSIFSIVTKKSCFRECVVSLIVLPIFFAIINLWWILPAYNNLYSLLRTEKVVPLTFWAHTHSSIIEVIRLFGHWAFYSSVSGKPFVPYAHIYLSNPLVILITFIIPLLAFAALLLKPKKAHVFFFSCLAIISIFLAKGVNPPLGEIYRWFLLSVPFSKAFRVSTTTFLALVALSYSCLIGFTCGNIHSKLSQLNTTSTSNKRRLLKNLNQFLITSALILVILANSWPLLTGDVFVNWYNPPYRGVEVPEYYLEAEEWLCEQEGNFRIFILPHVGLYMATKWGYQGSNIYHFFFSRPLIIDTPSLYTRSFSSEVIEYLYETFYNNRTIYFGKILGLLAVKYIIVDTSINTDFYGLPSVDRDLALLSSQSGIVLLKKFGNLYIYENRFFSPLVYVPSNIALINGSLDSPSGIAWRDDFLQNEWMVDYGKMEVKSGIAYRTLVSNGSYIYAHTTKLTSIKPFDYPYLLVRFKSNKYTCILTSITTQSKRYFLKALNPPQTKFLNHYKSTDWNTLVYKIPRSIKENITSIDLIITNRLDDKYIGTLELWFDYVLFARSIGSIEDLFDRVIEEMTTVPTDSAFILTRQLSLDERLNLMSVAGNYVKDDKIKLDFDIIDPTYIVVHVNTDRPFTLVFSESYDPWWKAFIGEFEVNNHFIINGFANAWYINKTGNFTITLKYHLQESYRLGLTVSFFTSSIIFALLIIPKDKLRQVKDNIIKLTCKNNGF